MSAALLSMGSRTATELKRRAVGTGLCQRRFWICRDYAGRTPCRPDGHGPKGCQARPPFSDMNRTAERSRRFSPEFPEVAYDQAFRIGDHKNIFFNDLTTGGMVQANQHIIIHGDEAMVSIRVVIKVHGAFAGLSSIIPINKVRYLFFSHQDPDIIAAANAWLMLTEAEAYLSSLWIRFITHFGIDEFVGSRIHPIPDQGMVVSLGGSPLYFLPAHFLHSPGNFSGLRSGFQDSHSGDLGASLGIAYSEVVEFEAHLPAMEGFHRRYIPLPTRRWPGGPEWSKPSTFSRSRPSTAPFSRLLRWPGNLSPGRRPSPAPWTREDLVYQVPS